MAKRYTQEEKEYMAKMAIEIIQKLDKDYPSFKNYVWAAQSMLNGKKLQIVQIKLFMMYYKRLIDR